MSSKRMRFGALLAATTLLSAALLISCGHQSASAQSDDRADSQEVRLEREYIQARAEMELARGEHPYLVFDPVGPKLHLKLKGAVVFTAPVTIVPEDSSQATDLVSDLVDDLFGGDQVISFVRERYLYSGSEKVPDSILTIIAEAVSADPSLIQRLLPERFLLEWEGGAVLDVRTTIEGKPTSRFDNIVTEIRQIIKRPFSSQLRVQMDGETAMTLYSVCEPGTPTILATGK